LDLRYGVVLEFGEMPERIMMNGKILMGKSNTT
jgi:hypothetical protein